MTKDIIHEGIERFNQAQTAYSQQRIDARNDLRFVAGQQWDSNAPTDEIQLTVNLLNPFLRQITAEARSANPSIKVIPTGSGADQDLADVRGGLIRNIEQTSDAESIYQSSLWYAAASGEGYVFIDSEYCGDETFDQDLILKACPNPEKVFLDPMHERPDGTDAEWAFVIEDISHESFKQKFPSSALSERMNLQTWNRLDLPGDWIEKDTVRLAKYWVKTRVPKNLWLVQDPMTLEEYTVAEEPGDDVIIIKTRKSYEIKVKCHLMNGCEVLETIDWPGKDIPIVKVTGDSFYVGGEKVQYGAVRHAKDPQKQYNYFTSRQTEMVDLAPKNSFVGATGQFANNPEKWANANRVNYGFLDYTPTALNGAPVPPPTRVSGLDMNAFTGVAQSRTQSLEDLKLVFGLHDAALGRMQSEASGVALQSRVEQSSRSTYHYFDNLLISIKAIGRQLNALIPFFYDTDRIVRIVKPTEEEQMIAINSISNNQRFDLSKGDYDVVILTGPAYASKRQEAFDALNGIMAALPQSGQFIGDLVASQIDSPIAAKAAARIKASIPPEILAATGENDDEDMAPAELLQKAQQELSVAQQSLQKMELEKKELEVKVKIAEDKAAMELTKMDLEHDTKARELEHQDKIADVETKLKYAQLALTERKLAIEERKLEIMAISAASDMNEGFRNDGIEDANTSDINIGKEVNIGGSLD